MDRSKKKYYKEIPGYKGYYVSKWGKVYSMRTHALLKIHYNRSNPKYVYPMVNIYNSFQKKVTVHLSRLVAITWIPNPHNYPCVCHKDNNPSNNHYRNLYWGTHKMNISQMFLDNRARPRGKLPISKHQIPNLIKDYKKGLSRKELRKRYSLSDTSITRLINQYNGKLLYGNYRNKGQRLNLIIRDYQSGMSIIDICKRYGIGHTTVNNIRKRFNIPNR